MLVDAQMATIRNWVTDDSPGVWESVCNEDSTAHAKVGAGDLVIADVHLVMVVPLDSPGSDYRVRLVAIDDIVGAQVDTTLFERSLRVDIRPHVVKMGIHVAHHVARAGHTRIQLFGYRSMGTVGGVRVGAGSHQRTIRTRREAA